VVPQRPANGSKLKRTSSSGRGVDVVDLQIEHLFQLGSDSVAGKAQV